MIYKLPILFLFLFSTVSVKAQCFPEPVLHVYLEDTILSWDASTTCEETSYIVVIHPPDSDQIDYVEQVEETELDVYFLDFCRQYIFSVFAVVGNHVSPYSQIIRTLQLPGDTSITITNATSSQVDKDVVFQWNVSSQYVYCVKTFKLGLWSEDSTDPKEITTSQNEYTIRNAPKCMVYQLEVSVVLNSIQHPTYSFTYTVPESTNTPSLVNISQGATNINITWALERYAVNRCNVSALFLQGQQFSVNIPIVDDPQRPNVDANLSGLRANSMYYFNVTVENLAGISKPFQLAVQTLPMEINSDSY